MKDLFLLKLRGIKFKFEKLNNVGWWLIGVWCILVGAYRLNLPIPPTNKKTMRGAPRRTPQIIMKGGLFMGFDYKSIKQESDMVKSPKGAYLIYDLKGNPWICGDMARIYFSGHQVAALCKIAYYTPFSGTSYKTTIDGVDVENPKLSNLIADGFDQLKFYYDFKSDAVYVKGTKTLPSDIRKRVLIVKDLLNEYLKNNF